MEAKSMRPIAVGVIGVIAAVVAYVVLDADRAERPDRTTEDPAMQEASAKNLASNPVQQWRDRIDRDGMEESIGCADSTGMMTCGKYAGQQVLVYLALTGARERIPTFATREILVGQGDPAVAAAAALGDLRTVEVLVAEGAAHGLLDENHLQRYPLFAGSDARGAHPAGSAAQFGHVDVLSFFVARGFDVNTKLSSDGVTDSFLQGLLGQKVEVVRYLLHHGYRVDCTFRFKNGRTYAQLADRLGFVEGASLIRTKCPNS